MHLYSHVIGMHLSNHVTHAHVQSHNMHAPIVSCNMHAPIVSCDTNNKSHEFFLHHLRTVSGLSRWYESATYGIEISWSVTSSFSLSCHHLGQRQKQLFPSVSKNRNLLTRVYCRQWFVFIELTTLSSTSVSVLSNITNYLQFFPPLFLSFFVQAVDNAH